MAVRRYCVHEHELLAYYVLQMMRTVDTHSLSIVREFTHNPRTMLKMKLFANDVLDGSMRNPEPN